MILTTVLASILGVIWSWIVWIVIGGIAGMLADRWILGNRFGIAGNVVIGIIGGLIGGFILGLFGIGGQGIFWSFVAALLGAVILLWLFNALSGGRARRL